eukprot:SAG31_NODE_14703_length_791_cov_1.549133_2_plen_182_part_01
MELYKDEVREVGEKLGLPHHLVWRHPFPGPGLGVRLLCHSGGDAAEGMDLDKACAQITAIKEMAPAGTNVSIPYMKSVGVQGDARTYKNFAILGGSYGRDWVALDKLATNIINSQDMVNRVTISLLYGGNETAEEPAYDVPKTKSTVTKDRLDLLRLADSIVDKELRQAKLIEEIWQCPVAM